MAILAFQKPDKVVMLESTDTVGRFEFRPLEPGYGMTIGNALRRVLLSSLEGYAITSVRIPGVTHEFDTITGVMEGMIDIILNLKQVRLINKNEEISREEVTVDIKGLRELKAGHLSKYLVNFEVLNPDLVLCRMEPEVSFQMDLVIGKGRGYVPAEENKSPEMNVDTLPIDSIHTPIKNVKYYVDPYRVEQKTDYDKLNLEIITDGSIHPKEALKEAAKILIHHLLLFSDEKISLDVESATASEEFDEEVLNMRKLLKTKLTERELSVRALNCLKAAEVETIGELVRFQRNDLLKFRNFGKKSLSELDELLDSLNLSFGMDVSMYKLDKE